jgi:urease accessory protein UreF
MWGGQHGHGSRSCAISSLVPQCAAPVWRNWAAFSSPPPSRTTPSAYAVPCHAQNLDNTQKADLYVGVHVRHLPRALVRAPHLCHTATTTLRVAAPQPSAPVVASTAATAARAHDTPSTVAYHMGRPAAGSQLPIRQLHRLTSAQQLARRRQGLCYNCDEQFIHNH